MLGIVLGLTLVSGQLLNAYSVASTAAADIPKWNFGFVKVNMIGYQAQVLPAILAAFVLVYLEKFFRKITPQVVSDRLDGRLDQQFPPLFMQELQDLSKLFLAQSLDLFMHH